MIRMYDSDSTQKFYIIELKGKLKNSVSSTLQFATEWVQTDRILKQEELEDLLYAKYESIYELEIIPAVPVLIPQDQYE
jgi:hypothetical protein